MKSRGTCHISTISMVIFCMNVKSKQSIILYFAVILLAFGSGVLLFIAWIIIRTNIEDLFRLDIISGTLFLIWIGLLPLILVGEQLENGMKRCADKKEVLMLYAHSPSTDLKKGYHFNIETLEEIIEKAKKYHLTFYTTKSF